MSAGIRIGEVDQDQKRALKERIRYLREHVGDHTPSYIKKLIRLNRAAIHTPLTVQEARRHCRYMVRFCVDYSNALPGNPANRMVRLLKKALKYMLQRIPRCKIVFMNQVANLFHRYPFLFLHRDDPFIANITTTNAMN